VAPDEEAGRERLAALLGRHYVAGRFDADELARRLDIAYGAASREQAAEAIVGLPQLDAPPARRRWGRRHGEADAAYPSWVPTRERFLDPGSQRVMRVWVDPADHGRHYVEEPSS
jgi:hypothetical protein